MAAGVVDACNNEIQESNEHSMKISVTDKGNFVAEFKQFKTISKRRRDEVKRLTLLFSKVCVCGTTHIHINTYSIHTIVRETTEPCETPLCIGLL